MHEKLSEELLDVIETAVVAGEIQVSDLVVIEPLHKGSNSRPHLAVNYDMDYRELEEAFLRVRHWLRRLEGRR